MACERVRLRDGSVVLANVMPGQTLTDADRAVLEEFYELLRVRKAADSDGAIQVLPNEEGNDE